MKVINEALLDEFRHKTNCEWCGRWSGTGLDPHHLWGRGMGGGSRLDVRINLLALCRADHCAAHAGQISRADLLSVVAAREGTTPEAIREEVYRLQRLNKHSLTVG